MLVFTDYAVREQHFTHSMRIIQLQLYLLVCCGAAEGFTDMLVDLGQTVTLQCEVAVKDVLWFLMKPSDSPVFILRSYRIHPDEPQYSNQTFSKTFSLQYNSSFFIHNISTNELGVYYCIQTATGSLLKISRGIRLYIRNHSADNQMGDIRQQQNQTAGEDELWIKVTIASGIMNCLVIFSVIVWIGSRCGRSNFPKFQPPNCKEEQLNGSQNYSTQVQDHSIFTLIITNHVICHTIKHMIIQWSVVSVKIFSSYQQ